ncbi:hypothetical protein FA15DRAFT_656387 [Coprinopsis marcescibilis]|uniref:Uncharacterized protein n=1 Tax=Coprinopsis marcescibilis TaxID=230819 RepID=A0A5C3KTX5_COPMA|nr:hypothetical protein FA15DRAFT_656387 [Coprinopsis marcescibilis]
MDGAKNVCWRTANNLYASINEVQAGSAPFHTVYLQYDGPIPEHDPPKWMTEPIPLCTQNAQEVVLQQLRNREFEDKFNTVPYQEFDATGDRVYSNLLSGDWAWEEATVIVKDETTHGAMLVPIITGLDKTTVSVATGHQEYHPFYISIGNISNMACQSHNCGVFPLSFLPIPKASQAERESKEYKQFVWLSCIVQGWCPKCFGKLDDLDGPNASQHRMHEMTQFIQAQFTPTAAWDKYDIHVLMAPNLLHQIIKGTFKDHLVTILAVPVFPGLRCFKDGQDFVQWTGDDSKALLKVYIPAIKDHIPDKMVQCLVAFANMCYIFRRNAISSTALKQAEACLNKFHNLRKPKHITAVKEPWRRSNRYDALPQMLTTLVRMDNMKALEKDFICKGMLDGSTAVYTALTLDTGEVLPNQVDSDTEVDPEDEDIEPKLGQHTAASIEHAKTPEQGYPRVLKDLADYISLPQLVPAFIRNLYMTRIFVHHSIIARLYAPSNLCGPAGMHCQTVWCNPAWEGGGRFNTVFMHQTEEDCAVPGPKVAQLYLVFSFTDETTDIERCCALVSMFPVEGDVKDPVTGMWVVKRQEETADSPLPLRIVLITILTNISQSMTDNHIILTREFFLSFNCQITTHHSTTLPHVHLLTMTEASKIQTAPPSTPTKDGSSSHALDPIAIICHLDALISEFNVLAIMDTRKDSKTNKIALKKPHLQSACAFYYEEGDLQEDSAQPSAGHYKRWVMEPFVFDTKTGRRVEECWRLLHYFWDEKNRGTWRRATEILIYPAARAWLSSFPLWSFPKEEKSGKCRSRLGIC